MTLIVGFHHSGGLREAEALVPDYQGFVALEAEVAAARADARAAGWREERKLDV